MPEPHLTVDWLACDGRGLCAELLPERISADEWGFPLIDPAPLPAALRGSAQRAVRACPRLALKVTS